MRRKRALALALMPMLFGGPLPAVETARAQEPQCGIWTAGMQDDEGGQVFTAETCAAHRPDAWLSLKCFSASVYLSHDLALGGSREPGLDETLPVDFVIDGKAWGLELMYQAMDGRHAADLPVDHSLLSALRRGTELRVIDPSRTYPERRYGLGGSSAAIGELLARCG